METAISLNEIGLYNPQRQSVKATKVLFVVRQKQFNSLLESISAEKKGSRPQHYLIIGQRGMGKTTLLKRIEVELHDEPYRKQFIPLLFPEEQYNVKNLATFWLNCLDALTNSLEIEKYPTEITVKIDNTVKELSKKTPETISEESFKFLMATCRDLQRRPVLLIDNIDLVFNRLEKHGQHDLRSVLNERGAPIIIGGGVVRTSNVTDYNMPFYDFFQVETLEKLSYEEFVELLKNLARVTHSDETVFKSIQENAARQRALYGLTGGNPRITVMLFKFILKGFANDINTDLEALADEATPLYKAKYEDLSEQQQIVLDAIAMNWHPIPLNQLSQATGYVSEQLSAPLLRLRESGWLETTSAYKAKGNAHSISERFFNIWFLMRCSRRHKEGVYCLSRFLECFYGKEELEKISDNLLKQDICSSKQMLVNMAISKSEILDPEKRKQHDDNINKALIEHEDLRKEFGITEESLLEKIQTLGINKLIDLQLKNEKLWKDIGNSLRWGKQYEKAVVCYSKFLVINPNDEDVWLDKGRCLSDMQKYEEAISCFNETIKLNSNDEYGRLWKGYCLYNIQQYLESIDCLNEAIKLNPNDESCFYWKGRCLYNMQRYEESIVCFDTAIKLNPENSMFWNGKGYNFIDLQYFEEAVVCFNKAIELDSNNDSAWNNKGYALIELKNYEEAAFAYEKSRLIVPKDLLDKFHLTFLYRDKLSEMNKAKELFKEIEQEINNDENKKFLSRYYLNKTLFELHNQNKGLAKEDLLQAFAVLENENKILSMANEYWWRRFGSVVIELGYGSWLLAILEEKGYDIVLLPYYTAIQALEIEKIDSKNGKKESETYLKNRAVEVSEPARAIIKKMRNYMD